MIKIKNLATLTLVCGSLASGLVIFTEKANAAPSASSNITFGATVLPSCNILTPFAATQTYVNGTILGPSGGVKTLSATSSLAVFDCNSDTVGVNAIVSVTQPIPVNATAIKGVHTGTVLVQPSFTVLTGQTGDLGTVTAPTDANGDVQVIVVSSWAGGEDLLSGAYSSKIVVNITAN